jgi:hypothetical protein
MLMPQVASRAVMLAMMLAPVMAFRLCCTAKMASFSSLRGTGRRRKSAWAASVGAGACGGPLSGAGMRGEGRRGLEEGAAGCVDRPGSSGPQYTQPSAAHLAVASTKIDRATLPAEK